MKDKIAKVSPCKTYLTYLIALLYNGWTALSRETREGGREGRIRMIRLGFG